MKNNLAVALVDEKKRDEYLHQKKYSILGLLREAYKPMKGDYKIKFLTILYGLCDGINPVLSAFIVYYLVKILTEGANINNYIITVVSYALIYIVLGVVSANIIRRTYVYFNKKRMVYMHDMGRQYMCMDLGLYENSEFLNHALRSINAFSSNVSGVEGVYHKMFEMLSQGISFLILGFLLFMLSPMLLLIALILVAVFIFLKKLSAEYRLKRLDEVNKYNRRVEFFSKEAMDFHSGKDLRLYNFKDKFIPIFEKLNKDYSKSFRNYSKSEFIIAPITVILIILLQSLSYYLLSKGIVEGEVNLSELSFIVMLISMFIVKTQEFSNSLGFVCSEILYFQEALDLLRADLRSTSGDKKIEDEEISIELKNVSFSYPKSDKFVLEDLSFKISAKERLALVGVNGAGKSTVVKLIMGFYKPLKGQILFNGIDSEELDTKERYRIFSAVFQETEPMAMTIAEIVSSSKDKIDRERVEEALRMAGLDEKINLLPKGIDTPMTKIIEDEGTLFSGGENQKLMIARALYKPSKVMIMDEPTASLDALAEEKIYKELDEIVGDKTLLFISHRLASTKFCDRIGLLDGGSIKEIGTHEELMNMNGLYKKMYESQGKYYKEAKDEEA